MKKFQHTIDITYVQWSKVIFKYILLLDYFQLLLLPVVQLSFFLTFSSIDCEKKFHSIFLFSRQKVQNSSIYFLQCYSLLYSHMYWIDFEEKIKFKFVSFWFFIKMNWGKSFDSGDGKVFFLYPRARYFNILLILLFYLIIKLIVILNFFFLMILYFFFELLFHP